MLRMTLAVAAGFFGMNLLIVGTELILRPMFFPGSLLDVPSGVLPGGYLALKIVTGLVFAVIAGCITAAIGKKPEAPTVLGALMFGMAIGNVIVLRGQPLWFAIVVPILNAVVAVIAGYRWLHFRAA